MDQVKTPKRAMLGSAILCAVVVTVLCVVSAMRASGQAQVQSAPVFCTTDYYPPTRTLVVHVTNNTGKDIMGYYLVVQKKLPNGSLAPQGNEFMGQYADMLDPWAHVQTSKDPEKYEREWESRSEGVFHPGATRDISLAGVDDSDVVVSATVLFYVDGSFDQHDGDRFKRMLATRQGQLLGKKETDKIIRDVLADLTNEHPCAAVIAALAKMVGQSLDDASQDILSNFPQSRREEALRTGINNMRLIQMKAARKMGTPSEQPMTERERLLEFVERQEKQVELMTPQCHLDIDLKAVASESTK
jgi:hypothetical protein